MNVTPVLKHNSFSVDLVRDGIVHKLRFWVKQDILYEDFVLRYMHNYNKLMFVPVQNTLQSNLSQ